MLTVFTSGHFLEFLTNNKAQREVLKRKKTKIRTALMRTIFRMYKLQAHTWHSALLRKQHCCLSSPSGAERDTPRVIFILLSLSIFLKSRTDSLPSFPLRVFILHHRFILDVTFKTCQLPILLFMSSWLPLQVLRYLAGGFGGQQSESSIKISWFQRNLC